MEVPQLHWAGRGLALPHRRVTTVDYFLLLPRRVLKLLATLLSQVKRQCLFLAEVTHKQEAFLVTSVHRDVCSADGNTSKPPETNFLELSRRQSVNITISFKELLLLSNKSVSNPEQLSTKAMSWTSICSCR